MTAKRPRVVGVSGSTGYLTDAASTRRYWQVQGTILSEALVRIRHRLWEDLCAARRADPIAGWLDASSQAQQTE